MITCLEGGAPLGAAFDLSGHVAIVTGANHGIGAATARVLAACGAKVALAYWSIPDDGAGFVPAPYRQNRAKDASEVFDQIDAAGGTAICLSADLREAGRIPSLLDETEHHLGPVDILVNNASGWIADTFASPRERFGHRQHHVSAEAFDQVFGVDARAAALLIAEFASRHQARGATWGRIVSLTSGGPGGFPNEVSYGAAKAALENYTMSAAFELARFGITANVVMPPVTDTGWVTDEVREHVRQRPDLLGVASADDVAGVIAYLVSDEAKLITGNRIHLR
jgi:3-oxoacyl-[acyl-carrier protein] reductase